MALAPQLSGKVTKRHSLLSLHIRSAVCEKKSSKKAVDTKVVKGLQCAFSAERGEVPRANGVGAPPQREERELPLFLVVCKDENNSRKHPR